MSEKHSRFFEGLAQSEAERLRLDVKNREAAEGIYAGLFKRQKQVIQDPSRYKSVLTPRRAGKTYTAISYALIVALLHPGCRVPIITLTLKSAKRLYWDPIRDFSKAFHLDLKLNTTANEVSFPNGSKIFLNGAENKKEIEKLRGGAYKLVILDECKSFDTDLFLELIDDVLDPAIADTDGTMVVIGTPGSILDGPFYEATFPGCKNDQGRLIARDFYEPEPFWDDPPMVGEGDTRGQLQPAWSRHHWHTMHNVTAPHIWQRAKATKIRRGWKDNHPTWQREWLGRWVSQADTYVYAVNEIVAQDGGVPNARCVWHRQRGPEFNKHGLNRNEDWCYILGMDMGFEDDFALVVVAYSPTSDRLYQVYDFKKNHLIVPQIVKKLAEVVDFFDNKIEAMVADTGNLSKLVIETLNQQYGYTIDPAERTEKNDHIELLNADLYEGKLKIVSGSDVYAEMLKLQWDLRSTTKEQAVRRGRLKEDPKFANHLCFTPGTHVQTSCGFKPIECVVAGDRVLTHTGSYQIVEDTLTRHYEGKLTRLNSPTGLDTLCTPEHKFRALSVKMSSKGELTGQLRPVGGWGWVAAHELQGSAVATACYKGQSKLDRYTAFMWGYYAAEGSCSQKAGVLSFAGHADEDKVFPLLEKGLPGYGKRSRTRSTPKLLRISKEGNSRTACYSSRELCREVANLGAYTGKKLHPGCMEISGVSALYCLAGWIYGDGHFAKGSQSITGSSVSEELAHQIAAVSRAAGVPCSLRKQRRAGRWLGIRGKLLDNDAYVVTLSKLDFIPKLSAELCELFRDKRNFSKSVDEVSRVGRRQKERLGEPSITGIKPVTTEDYVGPVYSLSVATDSSYTVNGLVTKNCDALLYTWRYSYHHFGRQAEKPPASDSPEAISEWEAGEIVKLERARSKTKPDEAWAGDMYEVQDAHNILFGDTDYDDDY